MPLAALLKRGDAVEQFLTQSRIDVLGMAIHHGLQARDRLGPSGIKKTGRERKLYEDILFHFQASLPAYFLAGRCIGVTPTCSSAVYGAP